MANSVSQQRFKAALAALNYGDRIEARRLLFQVVDMDPNNEAAYLLLSDILETRYERIDCLRKVLAINPDNLEAQTALLELEAGPLVEGRPREQAPEKKIDESDVFDFRRELLGEVAPLPEAERWKPVAGRTGALAQEAPPQPAADSQPVQKTQVVEAPPGYTPEPAKSSRILGMSCVQVAVLAILGLFIVVGLAFTAFFVLPNLLTLVRAPKAQPSATAASLAVLPSATPRGGVVATLTSTSPVKATAGQKTAVPTSRTATLAADQPLNTLESPTPTTTLAPGATRVLVTTKKIGPIQGSGGNTYTLQISIGQVRFTTKDSRQGLPRGSQFMVIDITILNLGPDQAVGIGNFGFYIQDAQGELHHPIMIDIATKCYLGTSDLDKDASTQGCVAFAAPTMGGLELIYQPIWNKPDFRISFTLR